MIQDAHRGIVVIENLTFEPFPALILNEKDCLGDLQVYLDAHQLERLKRAIDPSKLGFELFERDGRYGLRLTDGREVLFPSTVDEAGVIHHEMPGWSWEEVPADAS